MNSRHTIYYILLKYASGHNKIGSYNNEGVQAAVFYFHVRTNNRSAVNLSKQIRPRSC